MKFFCLYADRVGSFGGLAVSGFQSFHSTDVSTWHGSLNRVSRSFRLACLLAICLGVIGCSFNNVQPYPYSWNALPTLSKGCSEIFGQYQEADPKESGNEVPSLWAFRLNMFNTMRASDKTVKSREIRIKPDENASIKISYLIDGKQISDRLISSDEYICKPDGLQLTYRNEYGTVFDIFPNYGKTHEVAMLWRDSKYLYVRVTSKVSALILYIIPEWGTNEHWYRFPVQTPAAS